jgi:hypothetical protein
MTKASRPRSPKYKTDIRVYVGRSVALHDMKPFFSRRAAVRHVNAEVRRLWKFHETSEVTMIRGTVTRLATHLPLHQIRIDRDSAQNGWKRALVYEGPSA